MTSGWWKKKAPVSPPSTAKRHIWSLMQNLHSWSSEFLEIGNRQRWAARGGNDPGRQLFKQP